MAELFSSDLALMAATLVGLALTSVGILRDLGTSRYAGPQDQLKLTVQGVPS